MIVNVPQPCEVIDRQANEEFIKILESTFFHMTRTQLEEVYLYIERRKAIAISFDAEWNAFLGYTAGFNQPVTRTPLRGVGFVVRLIKNNLRARPHTIRGGRVFLASDRAFRVNAGNSEELLCKWIWLGDDPVVAIQNLLRQVIAR